MCTIKMKITHLKNVGSAYLLITFCLFIFIIFSFISKYICKWEEKIDAQKQSKNYSLPIFFFKEEKHFVHMFSISFSLWRGGCFITAGYRLRVSDRSHAFSVSFSAEAEQIRKCGACGVCCVGAFEFVLLAAFLIFYFFFDFLVFFVAPFARRSSKFITESHIIIVLRLEVTNRT